MNKKKTVIAGGFILAAIIAGVLFVNVLQKESAQNQTGDVSGGANMKISRELAEREMPYINISDEERALLETLFEDADVKDAIANGEIVNLTSAKSALLTNTFDSGLSINEISVVNQTLIFGYFFDGYRIILEMPQGGAIRKTLAVYDGAGNFQGVYQNDDNREYQKEMY